MMAQAQNHSMPEFALNLRGAFETGVAMSRYTSWRVGGQADYMFTPADEEDLVTLIQELPQEIPVFWLGLGSNLLVRDAGFEGVVIRTQKGLNKLEQISDTDVYAQTGVACAKMARYTSQRKLSGVEFLSGVPGTIGGALAMNAGAFGGETWDWVKSIRCCTADGEVVELKQDQLEKGYRYVNLPKGYGILSAIFALNVDESITDGREKIKNLLEKRGNSQPVQSANAGSVFRNPTGDYAARLLEESGLKGHQIGGASYSTKHANFIINHGDATANDIELLIELGQSRVLENFNIKLEPEVRIIGRQRNG